MPAREERARRDRLARQVVERRQEERAQTERHGQGARRQDHRLAEELPGELRAVGAHRLADAHLVGPLGGPGRGQVHEVDDGQEQHEERQPREEQHVRQATCPAACGQIGRPRAQVDAGDGLQVELLREVAIARIESFRLKQRHQLGFDDLVQGGLKSGRRGAWLKRHVRRPVVVAPVARVEVQRRE